MIPSRTRRLNVPVFLVLAGIAFASEPVSPARVSLDELARELGARLDIAASRASIGLGSRIAVLHPESRKLLLDGTLIWMNGPTTSDPWTVTAHDAATVLRPLLDPRAETAIVPRRPVVVLDPGHGGKSMGAIGPRDVPEKTLVLDIAKRTRGKLRAAGIRVKLTRRGDYGLSLGTRVQRTEGWAPGAFVSIHANHADNRTAKGVETFVCAGNGFPSTSGGTAGEHSGIPVNHAQNSRFALAVHRGVLDCTGASDRGIKRARFTVLEGAPCPALLVECGFLSHPEEGARLLDPDYRDRIAEGISRGITEFIEATRRP